MFYIHIPKTGGQTLATRLASAFQPDQTHLMEDELVYPRDLGRLSELLSSKKFIESHIGGPLLQNVSNIDFLATVRQPVPQMVSNLRHIKREPRNRWHKAAVTVSTGEFFDRFGDFFQDHQTRYIEAPFVSAGMAREIQRLGRIRTLHTHFFSVLDRIRWLVPTESIDEFVMLWSLETRRPVPNLSQTINVAPKGDADADEMHAEIAKRTHLYAFDNLLYETAKERFAEYRKHVMASLVPDILPENSRAAYSEGESGIWLAHNWYDPERTDRGPAWWSGPTVYSEVKFIREDRHKFIEFEVNVLNGIAYEELTFRNSANFQDIHVSVRIDENADAAIYRIPLQGTKKEDRIYISVPNCYAAIMTTDSDTDLTRRSFRSANWRFVE